MRFPRRLGVLIGLIGFTANLSAQQDPGWWSNVIRPGDPHLAEDNYAPANLGQLKHFASQARIHLDLQAAILGGAGSEIRGMVDGWPDADPANYAPLNLGQLKSVADKFYTRLDALNIDYKSQLIAQGYGGQWTGNPERPWNESAPIANNYAIANLGQLKALFSFDISQWSPPNTSPWVDAGPNRSTTASSLVMTASVTDREAPPQTLTYKWRQDDGPGQANFSNAAVLNPTVTLPANGSYTLRLSVSDGSALRSDVVVIHRSQTGTQPTVSLTAPANSAIFAQPALVTLSATATNATKVEYYAGNKKVGESTVSPYTVQWSPARARKYRITAKAIGSGARAAFSAARTIQIGNFEGIGGGGSEGGGNGVNNGTGVNPNDPGYDPSTHDEDEDGLSDSEEIRLGLDPESSNSDGDGVADDLDSWANFPFLTLTRVPETKYAVIDLTKFDVPSVAAISLIGLDDSGNVAYTKLSESTLDRSHVWRAATGQSKQIGFRVHSISSGGYLAGAVATAPDFEGRFQHVNESMATESPFPETSTGWWEDRAASLAASNGTVSVGSGHLVYLTGSWDDPIVHNFGGGYVHENHLARSPKYWYSAPGVSDPGRIPDFLGRTVNRQGIIGGNRTVIGDISTGSTDYWLTFVEDSEWVTYPEFNFLDLTDGNTSMGIPLALAGVNQEGEEPVATGDYVMTRVGGIWPSALMEVRDLGRNVNVPLYEARKINSRGEVLDGHWNSPQRLVRNGVIPLWSDLIEGWTVNFVHDINNLGVILAEATTAGGKKPALLIPVDIAVDANRDGVIRFAGNDNDPTVAGKLQDRTEEYKPFRFWCNDDYDGIPSDERDVVPAVEKDYEDGTMQTMRDLEDFARLYLHIGAYYEQIANGTYKIGLKFTNVSGDTPKIKVYKCTDLEGSDSYLTDFDAAIAQISGEDIETLGEVTNGDPLILPAEFWEGYSEQNSKKCLLFEGSGEGKGQLVMTIHKSNGTQIGEGGGCWLDLKQIKKMYQRIDSATAHPWAADQFEPEPHEPKKDVVVFVHGWRMSPDGAGNFAETMFKRLWWRGFKGRFVAFHWDTYWHDSANWLPFLGGAIDSYLAYYNDSERIAWQSAAALKSAVNNLQFGNRHMVAHSMGNIVVGEALKQGMQVKNYALLQAAVPAACYDESEDIKQTQQYYHLGFKMWDNETPDDDADLATRALAYRGRLKNLGGTLINFFLPEDYATSFAWEVNNDQTKPPNGPLAGNYQYQRNAPNGQKLFKFITYDPYQQIYNGKTYLSDPYESMPFACRTWGKAVGAFGPTQTTVGTHGAIDDSKDLSSSTFDIPGQDSGFGDEHSGEFNASIQPLKPFYDTLMDELELERNSP